MFPYLHDPNTGAEMYESEDIIRYLYERYGNRSAPWWLASDVSVPLGSLASVLRTGRGVRYRKARVPEQPLELWSFEASPFCRIAREALCELELTYVLHNVGKGSPSRKAFRARSGRMMVPWLSDPNTGREMFESADIRDYLYETYAET
jgi:glutathione S-transferase